MIIAVDFDGTIVRNKFPEIGREIPFAIDVLHMLQEDHHRLILWTSRSGKHLEEALTWCAERGLTFYAVNSNFPPHYIIQEDMRDISPKVVADIYVDDHNLGGIPDWTQIYYMISGRKHYWRQSFREKVFDEIRAFFYRLTRKKKNINVNNQNNKKETENEKSHFNIRIVFHRSWIRVRSGIRRVWISAGQHLFRKR